jgi:hypothetical protein
MKAWFVFWMLPLAGALVAQQNPKQSAPASAIVDSKGSSPQMQKVVEAFLGTWSIAETTIPPPGTSMGATHSGTEVWRTATGGITLIEENQTRLANGDAHDTALIWWDRKAERIQGLWCADINSEGCSSFKVTWEGGEIVMAGEWEDQSGRHAWKEEFAFAGPDSFTQTLLVGPPGGDLERVSVIRAKRARNAAKKRLSG